MIKTIWNKMFQIVFFCTNPIICLNLMHVKFGGVCLFSHLFYWGGCLSTCTLGGNEVFLHSRSQAIQLSTCTLGENGLISEPKRVSDSWRHFYRVIHMKFGGKKGQKHVKFGGNNHVYFGGQTYTLFTYTKTYIAFSNLWILKINKNRNLFF